MYSPELWVDPQSSFVQPVPPPATDSQTAPLVCLQLSAAWLPYVLGALAQLAQPTTWDVPDVPSLVEILGQTQDLIGIWGSAGECVSMQLQFTETCGLQISLDGGDTWADVAGWPAYFPQCVRSNQARVQMAPGYSDPPIPQLTEDGADWLYSPEP